MGTIQKVYLTAKQRKELNSEFLRASGSRDAFKETWSAYLPRAVSSVPYDKKEFLNLQYSALCNIVDDAGLEVLLPVELNSSTNNNNINSFNHFSLRRARLILPMMYSMSDGRSWEIGYTYIRKPIFPLVLREQTKSPNIPTLRLPFQVPIIFDDLTKPQDERALQSLLREMNIFDFGTGKCSEHGNTLIGLNKEKYTCMRCLAEEFFEVLPSRIN